MVGAKAKSNRWNQERHADLEDHVQSSCGFGFHETGVFKDKLPQQDFPLAG
jgi:hypothetical protein